MTIRADLQLDPTPEALWSYASNPTNDAEWIGGVREAEPLSAGPIEVGSRVRRTAFFLGKRIEYVLEVITMNPPRELRMKSVSGPFPMDVTYSFEPSPQGHGTLASIELRGDASGFFRLARPVVDRLSQRSVRKDLERLGTLVAAAA